ncbi:MAG: phosphoribosylanthranilate isomerase [Terriglobales bacterium]
MNGMIKICGLTCLDDALLAAEAGADALGFVYAPGRRQLAPEAVAAITAQLPAGALRVGVFVNATAAQLRAAAASARLSALQLHGAEPPSLAAELAGLTLWKAAAIQQPGAEAQLEAWRPLAAALLLDGGAGGTGERLDWDRAAALRRASQTPVIVAGGLTPDNVAACIRRVRPWGVDVSSGVESQPGRKDGARVRDFVQAARAAFAALAAA